jgi:hypothetical protein
VLEYLVRFMIGGLFVTAFAVLGDVLKPKSFAGLFAAAPSVALASLLLTLHHQGRAYAASEAQAMIGGAVAFVPMPTASVTSSCATEYPLRSPPVLFFLFGWASLAVSE